MIQPALGLKIQMRAIKKIGAEKQKVLPAPPAAKVTYRQRTPVWITVQIILLMMAVTAFVIGGLTFLVAVTWMSTTPAFHLSFIVFLCTLPVALVLLLLAVRSEPDGIDGPQ